MIMKKQNKMKLFGLPLAVLLIISLVGTGMVTAQTQQPGIAPDHPLYFIDELWDNVRYGLARGQRKAEIGLNIAEERVAEMEEMAEENAERGLERARNNYNNVVNKVKEQTGLNNQTRERIQERLQKHVTVLEGVLEKVPEQAQKGLQTAIENSQKAVEKVGNKMTNRGK